MTSIIQRTRCAAQLFFPDGCDMPLCTEDDCHRACQKMGIDPNQLIQDDSEVWKTICMCLNIQQGRASLSFRGDSSSDIVTQLIEASRQSYD